MVNNLRLRLKTECIHIISLAPRYSVERCLVLLSLYRRIQTCPARFSLINCQFGNTGGGVLRGVSIYINASADRWPSRALKLSCHRSLANGGSIKTISYCLSLLARKSAASQLYTWALCAPSNCSCCLRVRAAWGFSSTKSTEAAPRDKASRPRAPEPANRSRQ